MSNTKISWAFLILVAGAAYALGYFVMYAKHSQIVRGLDLRTAPSDLRIWMNACSTSEAALRQASPIFRQLIHANLRYIAARALLSANLEHDRQGDELKATELRKLAADAEELTARIGPGATTK
jgi:hypothetical protein